MFEVRRVEDRDPKTGRLLAIGVQFGPPRGRAMLPVDPIPQTEAMDLAVKIVQEAGGSVGMFETAWKRAQDKEVKRQQAASVPR